MTLPEFEGFYSQIAPDPLKILCLKEIQVDKELYSFLSEIKLLLHEKYTISSSLLAVT
jgi:hypothetical protein